MLRLRKCSSYRDSTVQYEFNSVFLASHNDDKRSTHTQPSHCPGASERIGLRIRERRAAESAL